MTSLYYSTGNKTHHKLQEWQRVRRIGRAPRKKHEWTLKDVLRLLAWIQEKDGISPHEILAAVAVALGFGGLFCKAARSIASMLTITAWLQKIAVITGTGQLIAVIITWLMGAKVVAPLPVKVVIAIAIAALTLIDNILSLLPTIAGDVALMREVAVTVNQLCEKTKEIIGESVESGCDATGDTCTSIRDATDTAAQELRDVLNNLPENLEF